MATNILSGVLGDIDAAELGWIYPHEHLLVSMREYQGESIAKYPGNTEFARRSITRMLTDLRGFGVNGIADPTPMGVGRDEAYVAFARRVSRESGVHVFLSTGLYIPEHWPPWAHERDASRIADVFTTEIERGIADTGVRPAFLKAAVSGNFGEKEEKALTACARAQRRTGVSVHVHATSHRREIVDLLTALDVAPTRIYLAHADMNTSEEEFRRLAERGVRLVMTNWDFPYHMNQDEARRLVNILIRKGHLDKILVSIDFALTIESRWVVGFFTWDNPDRTSYSYLHTGVLPKLRAAGVTDAHLDTIMRANPIEMLVRR